jgi:hypothetical protein
VADRAQVVAAPSVPTTVTLSVLLRSSVRPPRPSRQACSRWVSVSGFCSKAAVTSSQAAGSRQCGRARFRVAGEQQSGSTQSSCSPAALQPATASCVCGLSEHYAHAWTRHRPDSWRSGRSLSVPVYPFFSLASMDFIYSCSALLQLFRIASDR